MQTAATPYGAFFAESGPIREPKPESENNIRLLKPEYAKFRFKCDRNSTKWVRFLPNTKKSAYKGQWILRHQAVYMPNGVTVVDPHFFTQRSSPFFQFSMRLMKSNDPALSTLYRNRDRNPNGIATWPKDIGIARVIEIPTEEHRPCQISVMQLSMSDGRFGNQGVMHRIIELAQAVNDDPSLPREMLGMPKYSYAICDPDHGRIVGLTRSNTYAATISENEDYCTLSERLEALAKQNPEQIELATQLGLEELLYPTTEEEAHQLLQAAFPRIYPVIFPEMTIPQATGLATENKPAPGPAPNPLAKAVQMVQQQNGNGGNGHGQPLAVPQPPEVSHPHRGNQGNFTETPSKAPPAELEPSGEQDDPDEILKQLLAAEEEEPALAYESKNKMAADLAKLPQLEIGSKEYADIKRRLQVSQELVRQLKPAQFDTLKKMLDKEKTGDLAEVIFGTATAS